MYSYHKLKSVPPLFCGEVCRPLVQSSIFTWFKNNKGEQQAHNFIPNEPSTTQTSNSSRGKKEPTTTPGGYLSIYTKRTISPRPRRSILKKIAQKRHAQGKVGGGTGHTFSTLRAVARHRTRYCMQERSNSHKHSGTYLARPAHWSTTHLRVVGFRRAHERLQGEQGRLDGEGRRPLVFQDILTSFVMATQNSERGGQGVS